jgi:hypothetical protein
MIQTANRLEGMTTNESERIVAELRDRYADWLIDQGIPPWQYQQCEEHYKRYLLKRFLKAERILNPHYFLLKFTKN